MRKNEYVPEGTLYKKEENRWIFANESALQEAMETGKILEGVVKLSDQNFNLYVEAGPYVGIIPREEAVFNPDGSKVKEVAILSRVGKVVSFVITGIEREQKKLILSRKRAQSKCYEQFIQFCKPGDILPAKITRLEKFGAFADIGCGIVALLPIDAISISRIEHPSRRLTQGMEIRAIVLHNDQEKKRISLTLREMLGTWEENVQSISVGQTVCGIVRGIENYGAFIELAPNLAGLTEINETVLRQGSPSSWVGKGASVFVKSILPERMKVKLVLIDTYEIDSSEIAQSLKYYIPNTVQHIDEWRYSPSCAVRCVETVFQKGYCQVFFANSFLKE